MMGDRGLRALVVCAACTSGAATAAPDTDAAPQEARPQQVDVVGARFRDEAGKASYSGAELAKVPGTGGDPMRALQSLPGVASVDDGSGEPAVRGSRPSDNLYYLDFLPVGYLFHFDGLTSVLNPDLIQRFSLSSAAWSPQFGDAVGAVFDIQLRDPRRDRIGGDVDLSLLGANALAEGPLGERLSFFVAARRSWLDLITGAQTDKKEGVTFQLPAYDDAQGRLLWRPNDRHRLRLDFSAASDKLDFVVQSGGQAAQKDPVLAGSSNTRQSYGTVAATWEWTPDDVLSSRVAVGDIRQRFAARLGGAGTAHQTEDTAYARQQLELALERHELVLGTDLRSRAVRVDLDLDYPRCTEFDPNCDVSSAPRLRASPSVRQNEADLYVQDRWRFAPRWAATGGLRVSRLDYFHSTKTEPRVGLEFSPRPDLTLSAGAGLHHQPPDVLDALPDVGNPRLKPIESRQFVLGATQRLADGWSWRAETYAKTFTGYAVSDPVLNYVNGARGRAHGVELLVRRAPEHSAFSGYLSVSLSRSLRTVDATGQRFPFEYDQPVIVSLVGAYRLDDRWSFGAKWSYHSGDVDTPVVGTGLYPDGRIRPIYGALDSERLPAYHRLDLRADATLSPNWTAYFELINAYNRRNVSGYNYSPDYKSREPIEQLPILPSIGVKYRF